MKKTLGFLVATAFAVTTIATPFAAPTNLEGADKFLAKKFNLTDASKEFKTLKASTDDLGMKHVKLNQTVNGIAVYDGQYIVHFDKSGSVYASNGNYNTKAKEAKTETKLTQKEAIDKAKGDIDYPIASPTQKLAADVINSNLYLYNIDGEYKPVYVVQIGWLHENTFGDWKVFVDANTGAIVDKYNNIKHTAATGTGIGVLGDSKSFTTDLVGGTYYLRDLTRGGGIQTNDCNNGTTLPGTLMTDADNNWNGTRHDDAVDAHYYVSKTYDYYNTVHGRNSIDGNGMLIRANVHYDVNYVNAFWWNNMITFGDGDGVESLGLAGGLDIIAHEMSHGVDSYEGNLDYVTQSGALSESFADIMGAAAEFYIQPTKGDWLIGEDVWTPATPGDALRSMADPTLYGDPDHMNTYKNYPKSQAWDYGGVHTNSGIPNHAAYTMATVNNNVLGHDGMAKVWYRAMSVYFINTTQFTQARAWTLQAAADLYGSTSAQYNAVKAGWDHVGVY